MSGTSMPPRPSSVDAPRRPEPSPSQLTHQSSLFPFPSPDHMMESIVDSLQLLNYETRFCRPQNLPWLTRNYFVHDFDALKRSRRAEEARRKAHRKNGSSIGASNADKHNQQLVAVSLAHFGAFSTPTLTQQLIYLASLAAWLVSLLQRPGMDPLSDLRDELSTWHSYADYDDEDEAEEESKRTSLAECILSWLSASKLPIPSLPTSSSLASTASGSVVLQVLFRLMQGVYYKKLHGSVVINPIALRHYPTFEPSDETLRQHEEDNEDVPSEEEVDDEVGDMEMDAEYAAVNDGAGIDIASPSSLTDSMPIPPLPPAEREAAAHAWMEEWTRLCDTNALRFNAERAASVSGGWGLWRSHQHARDKLTKQVQESPLLTTVKHHLSAASKTAGHTNASTLVARASSLRSFLDRVKSAENRISSAPAYATMRGEHAQLRQQLDELQEAYTAATESIGMEQHALEQLEQESVDAQERLKLRREQMDDQGQLRRVRHTINTLKAELRAMDVQVGVKSGMLQQYAMRAQMQRNRQKR